MSYNSVILKKYCFGEREALAAFVLSLDSGLTHKQTLQVVTDLKHLHLRQFASHTDCRGRGEALDFGKLSHFPSLAEEGRELPALPCALTHIVLTRSCGSSELLCKGGKTMLLKRYLN